MGGPHYIRPKCHISLGLRNTLALVVEGQKGSAFVGPYRNYNEPLWEENMTQKAQVGERLKHYLWGMHAVIACWCQPLFGRMIALYLPLAGVTRLLLLQLNWLHLADLLSGEADLCYADKTSKDLSLASLQECLVLMHTIAYQMLKRQVASFWPFHKPLCGAATHSSW